MSATVSDQDVKQRVRDALSKVASARLSEGRTLVDLPIMYPSGGMVVVEVEENRDRFWVSDMGHGLVEAEFMGAQSYYSSAARKAAQDLGVEFDGNAVFALWVPSARLEAAIVCVANASNTAAAEAIRHAAEAQSRRQNERVFDRVTGIFGRKVVARTAEIAGRHAHWEAHNVVVFSDRRRAVFEFMKPHVNSVASKFWMFSDIRSADRTIALNAVVKKTEELDRKGQMIGDLANIVELDAPDDQYREFAERA